MDVEADPADSYEAEYQGLPQVHSEGKKRVSHDFGRDLGLGAEPQLPQEGRPRALKRLDRSFVDAFDRFRVQLGGQEEGPELAEIARGPTGLTRSGQEHEIGFPGGGLMRPILTDRQG